MTIPEALLSKEVDDCYGKAEGQEFCNFPWYMFTSHQKMTLFPALLRATRANNASVLQYGSRDWSEATWELDNNLRTVALRSDFSLALQYGSIVKILEAQDLDDGRLLVGNCFSSLFCAPERTHNPFSHFILPCAYHLCAGTTKQSLNSPELCTLLFAAPARVRMPE